MLMLQGVLNFVLCDSVKEVDNFLLIRDQNQWRLRTFRYRRWGGGASRPWDKGVLRSQKAFFRPFEPRLGLKIGGGGGQVGVPPGPSPGSVTENNQFLVYVHYLPSSLVLWTMTELLGPSPAELKANTWNSYTAYLSRPVTVLVWITAFLIFMMVGGSWNSFLL